MFTTLLPPQHDLAAKISFYFVPRRFCTYIILNIVCRPVYTINTVFEIVCFSQSYYCYIVIICCILLIILRPHVTNFFNNDFLRFEIYLKAYRMLNVYCLFSTSDGCKIFMLIGYFFNFAMFGFFNLNNTYEGIENSCLTV